MHCYRHSTPIATAHSFEMLRLHLFFVILYFVYGSCPTGLDPVHNGLCTTNTPYAHLDIVRNQAGTTAISKCNEIQAQPVIIKNNEDQSYWKQHQNTRIVLGLVCNTASKRWEWTDGSVANYTPSEGINGDFGNSPWNNDCNTGCTWYLYTITSPGEWLSYCNTFNTTFDIYCTTQLQQPVVTADGCDGFEDDIEDSDCYQIGSAAENWQDAQMICKQFGANLASIHNINENSFIRRLAVAKGAVHGVFLGATTSGKGNNYGWIDGSAWDYNNFYPGFPVPGLGDCIAMDTSTSSGQWMNVDCASKLPVACVREGKKAEPNPTCTAQSWQEGAIITSPGFPYNASVPCDFFLTVDAGKKVEVEISLLEANTCCDFLILNDGYFGGYVIANLTGAIQNKTYTTTDSNIMKVSWQPNGGVNVRGMAITFRGV